MDEWHKRLLHSRLLIEYTLLLSRLLPTDLLKSNGAIKHIIKVLYILRNSWIQKGEWNNVRSLWLSAPDYVCNFVFDLCALSLSYLVAVDPTRNGWFVVFLRFICISPQSNCQICQHRLIQKVAITVQLQFFNTFISFPANLAKSSIECISHIKSLFSSFRYHSSIIFSLLILALTV